MEKEEVAIEKRRGKITTDRLRVEQEIVSQVGRRTDLLKRKKELQQEQIFIDDRIRIIQGELQEEQHRLRVKNGLLQKRDTDFQLIFEPAQSPDHLS